MANHARFPPCTPPCHGGHFSACSAWALWGCCSRNSGRAHHADTAHRCAGMLQEGCCIWNAEACCSRDVRRYCSRDAQRCAELHRDSVVEICRDARDSQGCCRGDVKGCKGMHCCRSVHEFVGMLQLGCTGMLQQRCTEMHRNSHGHCSRDVHGCTGILRDAVIGMCRDALQQGCCSRRAQGCYTTPLSLVMRATLNMETTPSQKEPEACGKGSAIMCLHCDMGARSRDESWWQCSLANTEPGLPIRGRNTSSLPEQRARGNKSRF